MLAKDRIRYYDPQGKPYTGKNQISQWGRDFEDPKKKIVKQKKTRTGLFVSTVWLGLDHNWGEGKPLIFETMVFINSKAWKILGRGWQEIGVDRYSTKIDAILGHQKMYADYSKWTFVLPIIIKDILYDVRWKIKGLKKQINKLLKKKT